MRIGSQMARILPEVLVEENDMITPSATSQLHSTALNVTQPSPVTTPASL